MKKNNTIPFRTKAIARLLDSQFRIPGTSIRFGLDAMLGLVPGIGDWFTALVSLYFMLLATRKQADIFVLLHMLLNILIDLLLGSVPLIGEVFDVAWKANIRNIRLLERLEKNPVRTKKTSKWVLWSVMIVSSLLVFGTIGLLLWGLSGLFVLLTG